MLKPVRDTQVFDKIHGSKASSKFSNILWKTESLTEVASEFKFTRSAAHYWFKRMFGTTLKSYIAEKRKMENKDWRERSF